jgi:hypothetical protein
MTLEEQIINRFIDKPGDDQETRLVLRFSRDMQLIVARAFVELTNTPGCNVDRACTHMACSMIQGVASIFASRFSEEVDEPVVNYFRQQLASYREE